MADRGPVKIREGKIKELIKLYKDSYERVTREIVTATEAGKIQKARTMVAINRELERLGVDVDRWARREIPQYYLDGANLAVQDLRALGIDVAKTPATINRQAIAALTDDTALAFAEGIRGISRNARRVLSTAEKRQLMFIVAEGRLTGETRAAVTAEVVGLLEKQGLSALVDSGGKHWTFDTYAEMLVRTKAVEARNQGLANRMLASGNDLVQVTDHNSEHAECARWEGEILSLTGNTEGYDTLQDAIDAGLFHPNCEHAINVINPELADKTSAYDPDASEVVEA